jgi:hypothetical protein
MDNMRINSSSKIVGKGEGTTSNPFKPEADVNVQDQTTSPILLPLAQQLGLAHLTADAIPNSFEVTVDDVTDATVGDHFRIINSDADRYYHGTILAIDTLTLTLDTQIDFAYISGSEVTYSNINMAVNGSVTPVHFHLRTGSPSIPSSADITRIIMVCECTAAVDLSTFGDIAGGLTRGLVFRKQEDGVTNNILNVKSSYDMVSLAYDFIVAAATNPVQGQNGFSWRLTFGGQEKIGVVLRVSQYGQLGMVVQDNLSSLLNLRCVVEGHAVDAN